MDWRPHMPLIQIVVLESLEQLESFHNQLAGSSSKKTPCPAYWHAVSTREAILAEAPCACLLNSMMYAAIGFWTTIPSHSPCPYHKRIQQNTTLRAGWFMIPMFVVPSFPPKGQGRTFSKRMIWGYWFLFNSIFALISARRLGQKMVDDLMVVSSRVKRLEIRDAHSEKTAVL